ncbi:unnamed protein product [Peniophora sp. CBMAI 1063]|nr:unnamed protein product [Peniophora sp. CBMAI 1063]
MSISPINVGDTLPSITLKNEKGEDVDVSKLADDKALILFAVPKADTPGCNTQACTFRDQYTDFTGYDVNIYCISHDTPDDQFKWQLKKELPFPLLSDPDRVLIGALGAANDKPGTTRSHFVFAKGGKLVEKELPVTPTDSPIKALEAVKKLKASL